jgi:hypothetical protein
MNRLAICVLVFSLGFGSQVSGQNGIITTVAGNGAQGFAGDGGLAASASLFSPSGVAVDASGNLFIADRDNSRIRKVSISGIVTTVAGNATSGFAGDGGPATSASLSHPYFVAADASGNLFTSDYQRIRKVSASGIITTVAGNGGAGFSGDGGPATSATFVYPLGVAVDAFGNLFIGDSGNNRVRKVSPSGIITTVAGNGTGGQNNGAFSGDGGPATSAALNFPGGVAVDASGNLFIADINNNRIRKVSASGIITTVAGSGAVGFLSGGFSGDGGPATAALLASPFGVAVDASGNLFIADSNNDRIRKVSASGIITTIAGDATYGFSGDGGPAASASLWSPQAVAVDASGDLFIADFSNNRIRKVSAQAPSSLPVFSNQVVTTQAPPSTGCLLPTAATSFLTTDNTVYLYFEATAATSDSLTGNWLAPDNTVVGSFNWNSNSGSLCFVTALGTSLSIGNLPTSQLGSWQARVYDNGNLLFSVPFTVAAPPTSGPATSLTITTSGTGSGTVSSSPAGTSCGSGCLSFAAGTVVTLTATPNTGATFAGWSGACSGAGGCTVTMNSSQAVIATFNLTVNAATVIYSDFGANLSFNTTFPSGLWCVSGSATLNCGPAATRLIAAPVTPTSDFTLTQVQLALNYLSGTNGAVVQLVNSVNGAPGSTVLETWTVSSLPYLGPPPAVITLNSTGTVILHALTQYWLVAAGSAADTLDVWWVNNLNLSGGMTSIGGAAWTSLGPGDTLPAFALMGTQSASAPLVSIAVTPIGPTISLGTTLQLTAIGTYGDGSLQDLTSAVSWNSSNTAIATINTSGLVTGVSAGSATITANSGSVAGTVGLTIGTSTQGPAIISISALDQTAADPYTRLTLTGSGFDTSGSAISVIFIPKDGSPPITIPVSVATPTSLQVGVPPFIDPVTLTFASRAVAINVIQISGTTVTTSNQLSGFTINALPPVPLGVPAGALTAAFLSSGLNISATIQADAGGNPNFSNLGAALALLDSDSRSLVSAVNTVVNTPSETVTLPLANGGSTTLSATDLALSDQLVQAIVAAMASRLPASGSASALRVRSFAASPSSSCPTTTGAPTFSTQLCAVQSYFQNVAQNLVSDPDTIAAEKELAAELAVQGVCALGWLVGPGVTLGCEIAVAPVTPFITAWAATGGVPDAVDLVAGVGTGFLDAYAEAGFPVMGFLYHAQKVLQEASKVVPQGNSLSDSMVVSYPGGVMLVLPNGVQLSRVPDSQGSVDIVTLVLPPQPPLPTPAQQFTLTTGTSGSGSVRASSSSSSLYCGASCLSFGADSVVTLTASASTGSMFTGWSVNPTSAATAGTCGGTGDCTVTMNSNVSVTATFNLATSHSVTPAKMFLGNINSCVLTQQQLSQTFEVAAPAGVPWTAKIYGGTVSSDSNSFGFGITTVSPSTGSGSGAFTVTVVVKPEGETTCPPTTSSSPMYGVVAIDFPPTGNPAVDEVYVTVTWNLQY